MCVHICASVCICVCMCVCISISLYVCVCICVCMYVRVICVCMYVCAYLCILCVYLHVLATCPCINYYTSCVLPPGLAAGMSVGAASELARRALGMSSTKEGGALGEVGAVLLNESNVERLVSSLCKMRGAALKLGQMISLQGKKKRIG